MQYPTEVLTLWQLPTNAEVLGRAEREQGEKEFNQHSLETIQTEPTDLIN